MQRDGAADPIECRYSRLRWPRYFQVVVLVLVVTGLGYAQFGAEGARALFAGLAPLFLVLVAVHIVLELRAPRSVSVRGELIVIRWRSESVTIHRQDARLVRFHWRKLFAPDAVEIRARDVRFLVSSNLYNLQRLVATLSVDTE